MTETNAIPVTLGALAAQVAALIAGDSGFYVQKSLNGSDFANVATVRTNLGLGTLAQQAASAVAITGGAIDGTAIGGTTRAAGAFTTLGATGLATLGSGSANYLTAAGAAATSAPILTATGSDTNVPMLLTTKGVGEVRTDRPFLASTSSALATLSGLRSPYTAFWSHNNVVYAGAMAERFSVSGAIAGTPTGSNFAVNSFTISSDNTNATQSGGLAGLYVGYNAGGTALIGNRTAVTAKMRIVTASPNQTPFRFVTGGSFGGYTNVNPATGYGYGYDESDGYIFGGLYQARAEVGARFVKSLQGVELNVGNEETTVPVLDMGGIQVVMENGDLGSWMRQAVAYGLANQTAWTGQGWNIGFAYAQHNGQFSINRTYGTILGGAKSTYGSAPACAYGVDFGLVTFGLAAFRGGGGTSLIDGSGNIGGQTVGGVALETRSAINAYTAVVNTITVVDGSLILTKPTLTLSAPPGSGATATAAVNTMAAAYMRSLTGGTGYTVGDTVTLSGGTFSAAAVFTVDEVLAGVPKRLTIQTPGSYTVLPSGPVSTTTSGSGVGLTMEVWWTILTVTVTAAGTNYPRYVPPTVTATVTNTGGDYSPLREPKFLVTMTATQAPLVLNAGNTTKVDTLTVGSNQVVAARQTGWTAPTGTLSRATFDQSTVTLPQLAQRVAALITDLTTHGLVGA